MKKIWLAENQCTGCGACAEICPKKAIAMEADECGFIHPYIQDNCVECGLCERVCVLRKEYASNHYVTPVTYAAWTKNPEIRYTSTSGGVFSEFARVILRKNGVVAGAQYTKDNYVAHTIISDERSLEKIRQSKYLQSNPNGVYTGVKKMLLENRQVLFCGAPCQVAALYAFLGKAYDNLITVDFICRGMNSPKAYRAWLHEIESEEGCKATRVWFKYKEGGWKSSPKRTRIDFDDGHYVVKEGVNNLFMHGYLTSNLYIRPSCGNCEFKGVPRQGDLTVADFWGIESELDDDRGTSLILINSEKGKRLFDETKPSLEFFERNFEEIFAGNVCFSESVKIPEKSSAFLRDLDKGRFSKVLKRYTKTTFITKIKRKLIRMLNWH